MIKLDKRLVIFLLALIFLDVLILSFINRKSLCVQSKWIEEVVWHFSENETLNVYTCDNKTKTLYREEIAESVQILNQHMIQVEKKLYGLGNLVRGFRIHVIGHSSNFMQVHGNELSVSAHLVTEKGGEAFIRGLVKSWILQQQKTAGLDQFRLEALTSLFIDISELNFEQNTEWRDWVQSHIFHLTSISGWCNSPLKQVEYSALCWEFEKKQLVGGFSNLPSALWLAKKIKDIYNKLTLENRLLFFRQFHLLVENLSTTTSENKGWVALSDVTLNLRKEILVWSEAFRSLNLATVGDQLLKSYQKDEDQLSSYWKNLDFIFYQEEDWSVEQIIRFQKLSILEKNHKIIGFNAKGFWLWPFVGAFSENALDFKLKAKYVIYHSCDAPKVKDLLKIKWSDRVLWVQNCEPKPKAIIFNGFLHRGIQYFSLDNANIKFVSFYLPALEYLISKKPNIKDAVFVIKPMNDQQSLLAELASWRSALWNAQFRAYEVSAAISVVEWFKLPDGTWPEITHSSKIE